MPSVVVLATVVDELPELEDTSLATRCPGCAMEDGMLESSDVAVVTRSVTGVSRSRRARCCTDGCGAATVIGIASRMPRVFR